MLRLIKLMFALLLFTDTVSAQPYYFRRYETENGLSNNTVFVAIQDRQGFMWFGTKDGVSRFDGYRFKTYDLGTSDKTSPYPRFVHSLALDSSGELWVGAEQSLYRYDRQKEQFVPFLDSLRDIWATYIDKSGQLWFVANSVFCRYNFGTKKLTCFPWDKYFHPTSFCESGRDMWMSTTNGYLEKLDPVSGTFTSFDLYTHSPPADARWINKIEPDGKGGFFVATVVGIKQFDSTAVTYKDILRYNSIKATVDIHDILQVGPSEYWFGTESGIFIYNTLSGSFTNLKKNPFNPFSLSDNAVYALYKDREGGIWASTFFAGLSYYPRQLPPIFEKYFPDSSRTSLVGNAVREICEDHNGSIWIGTEDGGLNKLDRAAGTVERFTPDGTTGNISYSNIHGLMPVGNDLWVGTYKHGLDILDIRTGKVRRHFSAGTADCQLRSSFIVSLLRTKNGTIYVGTDEALYRYNPQRDNFDHCGFVHPETLIICLLEDHAGLVWVATSNMGIFWFDPRTGRTGHMINEPGNPNSLSMNYINSLYEDSRQRLWIGTEGGGLCRLSPDRRTFERYTTNNGLPVNFVFKIVEDDRGILWVTTSKGLVSMDTSRNITVYTQANGLLNNQFNYNSGFKDKDGRLYFGSTRGMISFMPDTLPPIKFDPPIFITGFQVDNKELEIAGDSLLTQSLLYTDKIVLPYNQSTFSIDFAAVSFTAPGLAGYRYIMEGLDKGWTSLRRNRKVYFTGLKPGVYTFKVSSADNDLSGQKERKLTIEILPPFWATNWAYFFYALIIGLLAWYGLKAYYVRQQIKKEKEIYAAKIEFFTHIAHEIRTPLTLIRGPVENLRDMVDQVPAIRPDVMTMERNTDRLVNLIDQLLDFEKTEAKGFSLDFFQVDVNSLLKEAWLAFEPVAQKRKLSCSMDLPKENVYIMADREAVYKILSNLFSNAFKYAGQEVNIRLQQPERDDDFMILEIGNDGTLIPLEMGEKIFEPFYRIKRASGQKGTGIGLALARSLAILHKGKLYFEVREEKLNTFILLLPFK